MNIPERDKIEQGMAIIGVIEPMTIDDKTFLLNEISNYVFNTKIAIQKGEKVFDYEIDYQYYWADFMDIGKGINLNTEDISWWEFDALLGKVLLNDNSAISKVLQFRTYEKPPKKYDENKEHLFYMKKKKQYALPQEEAYINEKLEKMYNFVASKKGADGNE